MIPYKNLVLVYLRHCLVVPLMFITEVYSRKSREPVEQTPHCNVSDVIVAFTAVGRRGAHGGAAAVVATVKGLNPLGPTAFFACQSNSLSSVILIIQHHTWRAQEWACLSWIQLQDSWSQELKKLVSRLQGSCYILMRPSCKKRISRDH